MSNVTGFTKVKIVQVCPDKEWIEELQGEEVEEPNYLFTDKEGRRVAILDFYMQNSMEDVFKYTIWLTDKDKVFRSGANQYVNCLGQTQTAESEEQLWDNFKNFEKILSWKKDGKVLERYANGATPNEKEVVGSKNPHIAKEGEADLLQLFNSVTLPNMYEPDSDIFFNLEEILGGNLSQINKRLIGKDFHTVAFIYVQDGKNKVFPYFFDIHFMKCVNNDMNVSNTYKKQYEEFKKRLNFCKGDYEISRLQEFKPQFAKNKDPKDDDGDY